MSFFKFAGSGYLKAVNALCNFKFTIQNKIVTFLQQSATNSELRTTTTIAFYVTKQK